MLRFRDSSRLACHAGQLLAKVTKIFMDALVRVFKSFLLSLN